MPREGAGPDFIEALARGLDVLRAFTRPLADVRVLIVGQDPYPTPGHPIGMCFACDRHVRPLPRSLANIYREPDEYWDIYETCEELVDLEDNFQLWRFRHLKTVQRVIGMKTGTGGSSGVGFLQRALDLTFFPELFAVRTEIGA